MCLNLQNVTAFQRIKSVINLRGHGEPRQIVRCINPKEVRTLFIDTVSFSPLKMRGYFLNLMCLYLFLLKELFFI